MADLSVSGAGGGAGSTKPIPTWLKPYLSKGPDNKYNIDLDKMSPDEIGKLLTGLRSNQLKGLGLTFAQKQDLYRQIQTHSQEYSARESNKATGYKVAETALRAVDIASYVPIGPGGVAKAGVGFVVIPMVKAAGREAAEAAAKKGLQVAGEAVAQAAVKKAAGGAARAITVDVVKATMLKGAKDDVAKAAILKAFEANDTKLISSFFKHVHNVEAGIVDSELLHEIGKGLVKYAPKAKTVVFKASDRTGGVVAKAAWGLVGFGALAAGYVGLKGLSAWMQGIVAGRMPK